MKGAKPAASYEVAQPEEAGVCPHLKHDGADLPAAAGVGGGEALRTGKIHGHGLFEKHMVPRAECVEPDRNVGVVWRRNHDGIAGSASQQVPVIGEIRAAPGGG